MDLRQLNYITVIAEELNLTRAAERLFVSVHAQSIPSRLEKELGIRLFSQTIALSSPPRVNLCETARRCWTCKGTV